MSTIDPNWFNNAVLTGDYAPSLKNVANPYQALQTLAGSTPLSQGNWRYYASLYDKANPYTTNTSAQAPNTGGVWNSTTGVSNGTRPPSVTPVVTPQPVDVSRGGASSGSALGTSLTPGTGTGTVSGTVPAPGTGGGTTSTSLMPQPSLSISTQPVSNSPSVTDYTQLFRGYDGSTIDAGPSVSLGEGGAPPGAQGPIDYQSLFKGYDGTTVGYDATTSPTAPSTVFPLNPSYLGGATPAPTGTSTGTTGTTDPNSYFPTSAQTLGQPMYPWLTPYAGQFTAPMSAEQNQGLTGISNFVGSGENLGGVQNYLNNVISGQYLSPSTNPNLQPYIDSLSGIHDYQDQLERERIGSSMAAGGNALSGARISAEEQYQNESNNQYQNMIASMLNSNYQNERGLQNSAIPLQMGVSNQILGGNQALMAAGGVPQQLSQHDLDAQYGDFLRQISGMQQAYNAPTAEMQALLHSGYPQGQPSYQAYGPSAANTWESLLAALLGGGAGLAGGTGSGGTGTSWLSSLISGLGSLFGGGTQPQPGSGNTDPYSTDYGTPAYNYGGPTGQDYGPNADTIDWSQIFGDGASTGDYFGPTYDPYYGPGQGGA